MQLYSLTLYGEIVGVRVVFWGLERAYDLGIDLFQEWNEGRISVESLEPLPLTESDGKYYTSDELTKNRVCNEDGKVIKSYLEFIYSVETCNLINFIVKYPNIEFGKTSLLFEDKLHKIVEVDFNRNIVIIKNDFGLVPYSEQISIGMLDSYTLEY